MNRAVRWADVEDLLFPVRCPFCGKLAGDTVPCADCAAAVGALRRQKPLVDAKRHSFYALEKAYGAYRYDGAVRRALLLAKDGRAPWYLRELTDLTGEIVFGIPPRGAREAGFALPLRMEYDCIVPVPDNPNARGYWVTGLLARRLGQLTGLPVQRKALAKVRKTPRQASLPRKERLTNLAGAFRAQQPAVLDGRRVLLVDDIITTGATVSACALALAEGGALSVTALSMAVTEWEENAP